MTRDRAVLTASAALLGLVTVMAFMAAGVPAFLSVALGIGLVIAFIVSEFRCRR